MSLFDAAVAQVVNDVGDKCALAVSDRNTADYCKLLSIVERKQHFWHLPWNSKFEYVPTELTLNDILELPPVINKKELTTTSVLFENYVSSPSFKRHGKIGGKVAVEFNIDASASKTLQVDMKLGNITKKEILWERLYKTVNKLKIKDHPLVEIVRNSKKRKLFIIGMIICAGEEEYDLKEETIVSADGGGTFKPSVALNLNASANQDSKRHTQFDIPSGTCLCYSCDEIMIDKNGVLNLQLDKDVQ